MADVISPMLPVGPVSMNVSLSGTNVFQTGNAVTSYSIDATEGVRECGSRGWEPMIALERAASARLRDDEDACERALREAIRLDPDHADAYHIRSQIYAALGRSDEAASDRVRALELDPTLAR